MTWWTELQKDWMPGDPAQPTEGRRRRYEKLREIVASIAPGFICEIGVRAGYSAWAMLSVAPAAFYLGIDNNGGTHGWIQGGLFHARKILRAWPNATLWIEDSQQLERLPEKIDLLHIDGDHSYEGCLSDLDLGLRSRVGHMVVDDTDYIDEVRRAVDRWLADHPAVKAEEIHDGHHGMVLMCLADAYD